MKTIHSPLHRGHTAQTELVAGRIIPGFEKPERAEIIRRRVEEVGLGPVIEPDIAEIDIAARVHDRSYLDFLAGAWRAWRESGHDGPALPFAWPTRGLRADREPRNIEALLGFYSFDGGAAIVEGTWSAVQSSYATAAHGAGLLRAGDKAAFALCRPPGHHAGSRFMGGYCYVNNAAVAAQRLIDAGNARVTILDVDYHHGNGTQEIFYHRADVQVLNLHGDPMSEYPFFLGHADERGEGEGEGFNRNWPMPAGTAWTDWSRSLSEALEEVSSFAPEALIVSLGVDTFERDPISRFRLTSDDYPRMGAMIATLDLPTLFVMEGGYAVEEIGINAVGVLTGFEERI